LFIALDKTVSASLFKNLDPYISWWLKPQQQHGAPGLCRDRIAVGNRRDVPFIRRNLGNIVAVEDAPLCCQRVG
jgi:hypothetical protein